MFKKKNTIKRKNTLELKYEASLEDAIKIKDKLIKLQNKIIALQEDNNIYQKELIEKYHQDIEKIKMKYKKGNI